MAITQDIPKIGSFEFWLKCLLGLAVALLTIGSVSLSIAMSGSDVGLGPLIVAIAGFGGGLALFLAIKALELLIRYREAFEARKANVHGTPSPTGKARHVHAPGVPFSI